MTPIRFSPETKHTHAMGLLLRDPPGSIMRRRMLAAINGQARIVWGPKRGVWIAKPIPMKEAQ